MHEILKSHILHLLQKDSTPRKLVHLEQELGIRGEEFKKLIPPPVYNDLLRGDCFLFVRTGKHPDKCVCYPDHPKKK